MRKIVESGDRFYLENNGLKAEILTPWSARYSRTRFNHSGFIAGVWLNGRKYTETEALTPPKRPSGGMGLCSEYKCEGVETDSAVGDPWLKIGVGVLTRSREPWNILDEQRTCGLPVSVSCTDDAAFFDCQSPAVNGYAYREIRQIQLRGNMLEQRIELSNTGEKDIALTEYCHNFVSLGGARIDRDHRLYLPCLKDPEKQITADGLTGTPDGAAWVRTPEGSVSQICRDVRRPEGCAWKLMSTASDRAVSETVSFTPGCVVLWSRDYCACVEVYCQFTVRPGERREWTRTWTFE